MSDQPEDQNPEDTASALDQANAEQPAGATAPVTVSNALELTFVGYKQSVARSTGNISPALDLVTGMGNKIEVIIYTAGVTVNQIVNDEGKRVQLFHQGVRARRYGQNNTNDDQSAWGPPSYNARPFNGNEDTAKSVCTQILKFAKPLFDSPEGVAHKAECAQAQHLVLEARKEALAAGEKPERSVISEIMGLASEHKALLRKSGGDPTKYTELAAENAAKRDARQSGDAIAEAVNAMTF